MKVLIFGAKGYLGGLFKKRYPDAITPSVDIGDVAAVAKILDEEKPDVVINTAGKTGRPNVDWCEDHKLETLHSNVTGPLVVAEACLERDILLVHISSGCIYEGDNGGKGFSEEDIPNFSGSYYSRTKSVSDQILKEFPVLILRLRMPFDGTEEARNLISKIKKYERVLDVKNSLTYLPDFLDVAEKLIEKKKTGIYNIVNPGEISPFEIMELYKKIVQDDHSFEKLSLEDLSDVVKAGRSNCILSTQKLEGEGISLQTVEQAVEKALNQLK